MYNKLLIVFLILLFGLILFQFLGTRIEGFDSVIHFVSSDGTKAIVTDSTAIVTSPDNKKVTYNKTTTSSTAIADSTLYTDSDGNTALITIPKSSDGNTVFYTKNADGTNQVEFTLDTSSSSSDSSSSQSDSSSSQSDSSNSQSYSGTDYDNYNHYDQSSYPSIFYGPNGATARIISRSTDNLIVVTNKNGSTDVYYIDTNSSSSSVKVFIGPNGGKATIIDLNGKKAIKIVGPNGNKIVYYADNIYAYSNDDDTINQYDSGTNSKGSDYNNAFTNAYSSLYSNMIQGPSGNTAATYDSSAYYNSLPQGIPKSMIPAGQEDLYILKSEVVPPVCTPPLVIKVPDDSDSGDSSKCGPCPITRCPEPSFECKKVPNYKAFNPDTMPIPVLNDFSTFGM